MSVGSHAYRHALQRAPSRLDYVWISDELLSSTFQRFVKGQRRYGSRVPGPLEASKRLAKRKNTALAVGGGSFDPAANVAHLFGANGTGHVRQWDDSPWSSRWPEPLELFSYSDQPPPPPNPSFLAQVENSVEVLDDATEPQPSDNPTFASSLTKCRNIHDVREALEWYHVDIRHEPEYSRTIFNHFYQLITPENQASTVRGLLAFLDDSSLNIYGMGNYGELFERLSNAGFDAVYKMKLIDNATKAIGLGLVPVGEISRILNFLPASICGRDLPRHNWEIEPLAKAFDGIWASLQSCSVFKLYEIDHELLEPWVNQLMFLNDVRLLRLAKRILVAYHDSIRSLSYSMSLRALNVLSSHNSVEQGILATYLGQALMRGDEASLSYAKDAILTYHRYEPVPSSSIADLLLQYLVNPQIPANLEGVVQVLPDLLRQLHTDIATEYIVMITERLTFAKREDPARDHAVKVLRNCLLHVDRPTILSAKGWSELKEDDSLRASKGLRVALRIWTWIALSTTPHRRLARPHSDHVHQKSVYAAGMSMLKLFDNVTTSVKWQSHENRTELLPKLVAGLQQLDVPSNQVLKKVYALLSRKEITNLSTLQSFQKLEEGRMTLEQAALQRNVFNSTKSYLLSSHLRVIRNVDVTSPDFLDNMVEMIEKDNSKIRDMIFLISLHTPLQVALAMASTPNAGHIPNTKRVRAILRLESKGKQLYLEPNACVSFIHLLASSIAISDKVSPRAAFNLVTYLYYYLIKYNGPVKPNFVRAMYHCGITRFIENGLRVSGIQEGYILKVVQRHEEPEAARALMNGSYIELY
ncbi:hypothetical protein TCE0_015r01544 [Talaromyces pinophilus]|uniref:Uncharacterized protein n=1 Tax=Talaromyces pinophilus TaxID=128442 RepID=A0A6V8GZL0_TALPI|nr:hypothetical protein TCE0_015r01544 [Talaromyces pinophilus]